VNPVTRLAPTLYDKVWGTPSTRPWFANPADRRIGEIWFSPSIPVLVKLLFTSEDLSVQVHPDDEYARIHENSRGKTEMWHILRADPGARIAVGVKEPLSRERLRAASADGEIVDLLNWTAVTPGETYFIPAGTIHAIGGGIALCEVQQYSDVTYRLYDYGRDRELHLDRGVEVAALEPHECRTTLPAECPFFKTDRLMVTSAATIPLPMRTGVCLALEGEGLIGGLPFRPGEAFELSPGAGRVHIESTRAAFLIASQP
jgi:mannose-6-phosphate isomerase